ncbi:MAG: ABC transporter ATP-binding protein [Deltaproteobacteria bacterium]|nr:MAG: ABC transporter ATP-binding protein [Deltaproteobacteria bacterium]
MKVFDKMNFHLERGERIGIVGPNGSGKTTLLHLIVGLLKPDAGEIIVLGKPRKTEKDFREVRKRVGLLFQDPEDQLFCPTVAEDVAFGPLNLRIPKDEVHRIVKRTLEEVGLEGFEDRVTYNLSGGEKKLVSLATLFAMNPEVLLLDEPTAGLDENATEKIERILKEKAETYIIVSHYRDVLEKTTNQIYRMERDVLKPI